MAWSLKKTKKESTISYTVFALACLIAGFTLLSLQVSQLKVKHRNVAYIAETSGFNLDASLQRYYIMTQFWDNYIVNNKGMIPNFTDIAKSMYQGNPVISSIEIAPGGVISYIYPKPQNIDVTKLSMLTDSRDSVELRTSKNTGISVMDGPVTGKSGNKVLIIHKPVYVKDFNEIEQFWGFVNIELNINELFNSIRFEKLKAEGFEYKLRKLNPVSGDYDILTESRKKELTKAKDYNLNIPDSNIVLSIQPTEGWIDFQTLTVEIIISLIICALSAQCSWLLYTLSQKENKMEQLSYLDNTTKLFNIQKFQNDMKMIHSTQQPYALLYIDIDNFKGINDNFGHKTANEILFILAKKIRNCVRENDSVFRIGGDEFAVLIPNEMPVSGLEGLSSRLRQSIERETHLSESVLTPSISIGFSRYPYDGSEFDIIVRKAEEEMIKNKKNHKEAEPVL